MSPAAYCRDDTLPPLRRDVFACRLMLPIRHVIRHMPPMSLIFAARSGQVCGAAMPATTRRYAACFLRATLDVDTTDAIDISCCCFMNSAPYATLSLMPMLTAFAYATASLLPLFADAVTMPIRY